MSQSSRKYGSFVEYHKLSAVRTIAHKEIPRRDASLFSVRIVATGIFRIDIFLLVGAGRFTSYIVGHCRTQNKSVVLLREKDFGELSNVVQFRTIIPSHPTIIFLTRFRIEKGIV